MGWPKGKPRKGYVKPDNVIYLAPIPELPAEPVLHGMTGTAITQPCPLCLFAYADGGYCPDCGWTLPIRIDPYGTHSGGKLGKKGK